MPQNLWFSFLCLPHLNIAGVNGSIQHVKSVNRVHIKKQYHVVWTYSVLKEVSSHNYQQNEPAENNTKLDIYMKGTQNIFGTEREHTGKLYLYEGHLESNAHSSIYNFTQWSEKKKWRNQCKRQDMGLLRLPCFHVCITFQMPLVCSFFIVCDEAESKYELWYTSKHVENTYILRIVVSIFTQNEISL